MDLQSGDEVDTRGSKVVVKIGGTAIMHLETDTVFKVPQTPEEGARERAAFLDKTLELMNPFHQVTPEEYRLLDFPTTKDALGGIKLRGDESRTLSCIPFAFGLLSDANRRER